MSSVNKIVDWKSSSAQTCSLIHWKLEADTTVWGKSSSTTNPSLCTDTHGIVPWFRKERFLMLYASPDSSSPDFSLLWVDISRKHIGKPRHFSWKETVFWVCVCVCFFSFQRTTNFKAVWFGQQPRILGFLFSLFILKSINIYPLQENIYMLMYLRV